MFISFAHQGVRVWFVLIQMVQVSPIMYLIKLFLFAERFNETIFDALTTYLLNICEVCGSSQCPYCSIYNAAIILPVPVITLLATSFYFIVRYLRTDLGVVQARTTTNPFLYIASTWVLYIVFIQSHRCIVSTKLSASWFKLQNPSVVLFSFVFLYKNLRFRCSYESHPPNIMFHIKRITCNIRSFVTIDT